MILNPTPEWAITLFERVLKTDDPDALDALMILLAGIAPAERENDEAWQQEEKYKHDAAWAAIQHGYRKTTHCDAACLIYLREVV